MRVANERMTNRLIDVVRNLTVYTKLRKIRRTDGRLRVCACERLCAEACNPRVDDGNMR